MTAQKIPMLDLKRNYARIREDVSDALRGDGDRCTRGVEVAQCHARRKLARRTCAKAGDASRGLSVAR